MPPAFLKCCRETKIKQLESAIQTLITVKTSDTVAEAFTQLIRNQILSAPVYDIGKKIYCVLAYVGYFDLHY